MNEVRVLVLSPFDYVYGSKEISYWCGDFFYLNPSSSEEHLEELKFILDSSYLLKGWIYLEDSIKLDYKNKTGVFTPQISISSEPKEESSSSLSEPEIKIEEVKETQINSSFETFKKSKPIKIDPSIDIRALIEESRDPKIEL